MRDLLQKLDMLEAKLSASEIPATKASNFVDPITKKRLSRPELFIWKVKNSSAFTRLDGSLVVIDPAELASVTAWVNQGMLKPISLRTTDGETVKNTDLFKTVEFGSKEAETIKLKGSDIFTGDDVEIVDFGNNIQDVLKAGGFPASEMYSKISNNPGLKQLGKIGDAVILMAREANEGMTPRFPPGLKDQEKKAIELYASEYLGVLGLLSNAVKFKSGNRKELNEFLGTDLKDMIMYFPKSVSNPLADSFSVVNDETGHALKISSKAAGKGAPPSLGSVKLPDDVKTEYPECADFMQTAADPSLSGFTQPFAMMNWLANNAPNSVPAAYRSVTPFPESFIKALEVAYKKGDSVPAKTMKIFQPQMSDVVRTSDSPDALKIFYTVTKDIINAVNNENAVKNFQKAVIKSLGYNFIQLYSNIKGDQLVTEAFWPATIRGQAKLKTKSSSKEVKGKISVEVSPGKDNTIGPEVGTAGGQETKSMDDPEDIKFKRSRVRANKSKSAQDTDDKRTFGRSRRAPIR